MQYLIVSLYLCLLQFLVIVRFHLYKWAKDVLVLIRVFISNG